MSSVTTTWYIKFGYDNKPLLVQEDDIPKHSLWNKPCFSLKQTLFLSLSLNRPGLSTSLAYSGSHGLLSIPCNTRVSIHLAGTLFGWHTIWLAHHLRCQKKIEFSSSLVALGTTTEMVFPLLYNGGKYLRMAVTNCWKASMQRFNKIEKRVNLCCWNGGPASLVGIRFPLTTWVQCQLSFDHTTWPLASKLSWAKSRVWSWEIINLT